ncbi:MAG TPA: hypothetical protein DHW64_09190, partial [Chitinophagaceae bacterium]|nr:hypothetical protein [Chitinophagaceae bacterium]
MLKNTILIRYLLITVLGLLMSYSASGMQRDSLSPAAKGQLIAAARTVKLQRGTEITLRLDEPVKSQNAYLNKIVQMSVYGDIIIDNDIIINTNLSAEGVITELEEPK